MVGNSDCLCIFTAMNLLDGIPVDWNALQQLHNCKQKFHSFCQIAEPEGFAC